MYDFLYQTTTSTIKSTLPFPTSASQADLNGMTLQLNQLAEFDQPSSPNSGVAGLGGGDNKSSTTTDPPTTTTIDESNSFKLHPTGYHPPPFCTTHPLFDISKGVDQTGQNGSGIESSNSAGPNPTAPSPSAPKRRRYDLDASDDSDASSESSSYSDDCEQDALSPLTPSTSGKQDIPDPTAPPVQPQTTPDPNAPQIGPAFFNQMQANPAMIATHFYTQRVNTETNEVVPVVFNRNILASIAKLNANGTGQDSSHKQNNNGSALSSSTPNPSLPPTSAPDSTILSKLGGGNVRIIGDSNDDMTPLSSDAPSPTARSKTIGGNGGNNGDGKKSTILDDDFKSVLPCGNCDACWFCLLSNSTMVDYRYLNKAPVAQTDGSSAVVDKQHEYQLGRPYQNHLPDIILDYFQQQENYIQSFYHAQSLAEHRIHLRHKQQMLQQQESMSYGKSQPGHFSQTDNAQQNENKAGLAFAQGHHFTRSLALQIDNASSAALTNTVSPKNLDQHGQNHGERKMSSIRDRSQPDMASSSSATALSNSDIDLRGMGDEGLNSLLDEINVLQGGTTPQAPQRPAKLQQPTLAPARPAPNQVLSPSRQAPTPPIRAGKPGLSVSTQDGDDSPKFRGLASPAPSDQSMLRTTTLMIDARTPRAQFQLGTGGSDDDSDESPGGFATLDPSLSFFQNRDQLLHPNNNNTTPQRTLQARTPQHQAPTAPRPPGASPTNAGPTSTAPKPPETPRTRLMSKFFSKDKEGK